MVTGILAGGLALALALLVALHTRLAGLRVVVGSLAKREGDEGIPKALDAMEEEVVARVGPAVLALRQYEENIAGTYRAQVAEAETRARVGERRASEVADVLGEARALLRELGEALDATHALRVPRPAHADRSDTPTLPPSEPPPGASDLPSAEPARCTS